MSKHLNDRDDPELDHDCGISLDELTAFTKGLLSKESRAELERHIISCPACSSIIEDLEKATPAVVQDFLFSPLEKEEIIPFPSQLEKKLKEFSTNQGLSVLGKKLESLAGRARLSLEKVRDLLSIENLSVSSLHPASVRSDEELEVQVDLVHYTGNTLIEENLVPHIKGNTWSLSGFSKDFVACRAYMLLLSIKQLRTWIPDWDRSHSQEMLTNFLRNTAHGGKMVDSLFTITGRFSVQENIVLTFVLDDDVTTIMQLQDDVAVAILLLP